MPRQEGDRLPTIATIMAAAWMIVTATDVCPPTMREEHLSIYRLPRSTLKRP
jgi:hypothetical protein